LAQASTSPAGFDVAASVARAYAGLMLSTLTEVETGLGGRLLYAGELDDAGRALVVAANIAGAATLTATADRGAQKQALRDGVTDFLVTSLDEALRILKNELRKRQTVSVCAGLPPENVEHEMEERGVLPDLLRSDVLVTPYDEAMIDRDEEEAETNLTKIPDFVTWHVESGFPQELAKLDEIALNCLDADEWQARRWLRLAPRYLGRMAQGLRLIEVHREFAARFSERVAGQVNRGEIAFTCEIRTYGRGLEEKQWFNAGKI
jgi:urocanate hydratase